jgi:hypothetical protein
MTDEKDRLEAYLSSPEFGQRVEAIVNTFASLKNDLDQEKRAMNRLWARRERLIDRVNSNISAIYGHLDEIVGPPLPKIKCLEMGSLQGRDESGMESEGQ